MDEEKVTQTAMEPAQQPKPKARGGQRTQGVECGQEGGLGPLLVDGPTSHDHPAKAFLVDQRRLLAGGDEVEDGLGVRGRLEDGPPALQVALDGHGVGQVAVVGQREAAGRQLGIKRLDVAQHGFTGCGIAVMTDRAIAFEFGNQVVHQVQMIVF